MSSSSSASTKRKHSRTSSNVIEKRPVKSEEEPDTKRTKKEPIGPGYTPPTREGGGSLGGLPLYGEVLPTAVSDIPLTAKDVCSKLCEVLLNVKDLKTSGNEVTNEVKTHRTKGLLLFAQLRQLNRLSNLYVKDSRDKTLDKKLSVDELYLQLQNLQYEVKHLQKEITGCLEFKSKHEDLDLISEEEFYETAPESLTNPEVTRTDSHKLMLARLEWELKQREQLASRLSSLETAIKSKEEQTHKLEDKLSRLRPSLDQLRVATLPLEEFLDIPLDWEREQHHLAALLPRPLYVLYVQGEGYSKAEDTLLKVIVNGGIEEARAFNVAMQQEQNKGEVNEDKTALESADGKKRKRHKSTKQSEEAQQVSFRESFPLSVSLQITTKGVGVVTLSFNFLPFFNAVCSTVTNIEFNEQETTDSSSGGETTDYKEHFFDKSVLLYNLFDNDSGKTSPNSAVSVQIRKYGGGNFSTAVRQYGFPYKWVQQVCGINISSEIINDFNDVKLDNELSSSSLVDVIAAVRRRMTAQFLLARQISCLNQLSLVLPGQEEVDDVSFLSQFTRCKLLSLSEVQSSQFGGLAIFNLQERSNRFFLATFSQEQARWHCIVCLSPEYPKVKPVLALLIEMTEKQREPYDLQIKSIEADVNIHYPYSLSDEDNLSGNLLLLQLQRMRCLVENYISYKSGAMKKPFSISPRGKGRLLTSQTYYYS